MAKIFPNDLERKEQVKGADVLLMADSEDANIAKNVSLERVLGYVADAAHIEEMVQTNASQQATIAEQQATIAEQQEAGNLLLSTQQAPALEKELATAKVKLATAITRKGVATDSSESLTEMAEKVGQIQRNNYTIDGGEMYSLGRFGTTTYDLYQVGKDLKNKYVNTDQYAGFILAQFYKGYETLDLRLYGGGFAACLTNDGDWYFADDEEKPIEVHTWHDAESGKVDRWVAFFYPTNGYVFESAEANVCPRKVFICGDCETLYIRKNRLTDIIVPKEFGKLGNFNNNSAGNFSSVQVIENMPIKNDGLFYINTGSIISIEFSELKEITGGTFTLNSSSDYNTSSNTLLSGGSAGGWTNLVSLSLPKLETMNGGAVIFFVGDNNYENMFADLVEIYVPKFREMKGGCFLASGGATQTIPPFPKLTEFNFPAYEVHSGGRLFQINDRGGNQMVNVKKINLPNFREQKGGEVFRFVASYWLGVFRNLEELNIPKFEKLTGGTFMIAITPDNENNYNNSFLKMRTLTFPALREINGGRIFTASYNRTRAMLFHRIELPKLEILVGSGITNINSYYLQSLYIGYSENDPANAIAITGFAASNLTDIELKEGFRKPFTCSAFTALTAENIALHILDRLGDNTDGNTLTINIGTTNLNKILADETYSSYVAAAQAKNYTII